MALKYILIGIIGRMNTLVHFDQIWPENGQMCSNHGFHGLQGNANQRKTAVAVARILLKIN